MKRVMLRNLTLCCLKKMTKRLYKAGVSYNQICIYKDSSDSSEDTEDKFGNLQLSDIDLRTGKKIMVRIK